MPDTVVICRRCPRKTRRSKPCKTPQTSPAKARKKACMVSLAAGDRLAEPIGAQGTPVGNSFWLRLGRAMQIAVQITHTPHLSVTSRPTFLNHPQTCPTDAVRPVFD